MRSALGRFWRFGRWPLLWLALVWLGLTYVRPSEAPLPDGFASRFYAPDASVLVRLDDEKDCPPSNDLDPPLDLGLDQHHLLVTGLLVDLEARDHGKGSNRVAADSQDRRIQIVVVAMDSPTQAIGALYRARLRAFGPFRSRQRAYGLTALVNDERARFGGREIRFASGAGLSAGFILCDVPDGVSSPACRHEFAFADRFVVTATYGRSFLSQWRTIADQIERLFEEPRTASGCSEAPPT